METLEISVTVSVTMQKYDALLINPIGSERWKTTSFGSSFFLLGIKNTIGSMSSRRVQRLVYVSTGSNFLMYNGHKRGSYSGTLQRIICRVPQNCIDSIGGLCCVSSLILLQVKFK